MLQRLGQCWVPQLAQPARRLFQGGGFWQSAGEFLSDCLPAAAACCGQLQPVSLSHLPAAGTAWRCMPELACWLTQTASGRCWLRYCLPPRRVLQFASSGDPGLNPTP